MTQIPGVPSGATPPPTSTQSSVAQAAKEAATKSGGTFNWIIHSLNGITTNEAWLLKLFKEYLGGIKQFANLVNAITSALQDLTSKNPVDAAQDIQTLIKDLHALNKLPGNIKDALTKMMEKKYGTPLPAKAEKFIKEATSKIQGFVNIIRAKLKEIDESSSPNNPAVELAYLLLRLSYGETVSPKVIAEEAGRVRADMSPSGKHTAAWYSMNSINGTLQESIEGAEFLNTTVSAREQEIAGEIQALFQGIAKTVDKQFKTLMMMIRGVLSR